MIRAGHGARRSFVRISNGAATRRFFALAGNTNVG